MESLLVVEPCFCAPISNATLERLFSHMNLVKTNIQNRLTPFYEIALMEYQCKPFTTSSLISTFSTGITQRSVVYSKKTKQNKRKT